MGRKLKSTRESAIQRGKRWARQERQGGDSELGGFAPFLKLGFVAIMLFALGISLTMRGKDWGPELAIVGIGALTFIGWRMVLHWRAMRERRNHKAELRTRMRREAE